MNTDKHRLKKAMGRASSRAIPASVLSEPKLTKTERTKIEQAWKIEIRRRVADLKSGKVKCVPAEEAMRNAYRALDRVARQRRTQAKRLLISTGLQPGVGDRLVTSAVSTASRARGKAAKAAGRSLGRRVTGLKPGANESLKYKQEFR